MQYGAMLIDNQPLAGWVTTGWEASYLNEFGQQKDPPVTGERFRMRAKRWLSGILTQQGAPQSDLYFFGA
jgi:hypothetical protein